MIRTLGISLAVATILSMSGCSSSSSDAPSGGNNSTGKSITGTVSGNGYAKNDIINRFLNNIITPVYALPIGAPDKIVVMYNNVKYDSTSNEMSIGYKEFDINPIDGSFNIDTSLLTKNNLTIFVVDSKPTLKKIFGNLNLGTSTNEKLDYFDKSKLIDDLKLGSIDTESNCSTSATVSSVGAFSNDDITTLEKIAKLDDGLITYGNHYRNLDSNGKIWVDSIIQYSFHADTLTNITSQENDITDFNSSKLSDKNINIISKEWVNVSDDDISLYPPSAIKYNENGTNTYNGDANQTVKVPLRGCDSFGEVGNWENWKDCGIRPLQTIPSGDWILKVENVEKARFEFKDVDPFEANGKLKVPIPKFKINMNGASISSIDTKWYIYNGSTYEEATEEIMKSLAISPSYDKPQISIAIKDEDGVSIVGNNWNGNYPMPSDKQSLEIGTTTGKVERISMEYSIGQVKYYFRFYN